MLDRKAALHLKSADKGIIFFFFCDRVKVTARLIHHQFIQFSSLML